MNIKLLIFVCSVAYFAPVSAMEEQVEFVAIHEDELVEFDYLEGMDDASVFNLTQDKKKEEESLDSLDKLLEQIAKNYVIKNGFLTRIMVAISKELVNKVG